VQYTTLGDTGLIVSRLALGTMTFTAGDQSVNGIYKTDPAAADALVGRAIDAGVNYLDTADIYASGESEQILGAAIKKLGRRDQLIIASKVGIRSGSTLTRAGLNRRHILWSVEESLKRLGTDWLDIYIAHIEDTVTPLEETLQALDTVVREGKVRYLGFSNWPAWKVAAALEIQTANNLAPFTHGQLYYSLLGRDIERDFVPVMRRYGLGMTIWSPLAGGFLTGKYTRENLNNPDNRYSGFDILPFDKEQGFALVEKLRLIARNHEITVAQTAIAWLLAKDFTSSVIMGVSKMSQLEDNLGASDVRLTAEEVADLDAQTSMPPVYPNWLSQMMIDPLIAKALDRR
jgi:aryl-alcohol dehydrogenase-like predicted oxidoreductase